MIERRFRCKDMPCDGTGPLYQAQLRVIEAAKMWDYADPRFTEYAEKTIALRKAINELRSAEGESNGNRCQAR